MAPSISANVSPETHIAAKHAAVDAGMTLRKWAGEAIEEHLRAHRQRMRNGDKMPKPRTRRQQRKAQKS